MKRATFRRNTLVLALAIAYYGSAALALPAGLGATQGVGGVVTAGPVMTVTTQAGKSIANWQSFSIGAGEKVIINQPNAGSTMLNRVTGADPSAIYGRLQSNGAVWLVNPAGIMVGPGGRVDTAAFVASTLSVTNTDFLAGRLNFGGDAAEKLAGRITNDGEIRTPAGGSILIVAPQIENNGVMTSPGGEIILAAGHSVQVLNTGTPGVVVEVKAERGELNLSQMVASGKVFARNSGRVSASNVVAEGGRVFLRSSPADGGVAVNTGALEAEGAPGKGGFIDTSGFVVEVTRGQIKVGSGGTWLLDPYDVVVDDVLAATGQGVLDGNGNWEIETTSGAMGGPGAGDIIFATPFLSLGYGQLILKADHDVVIDGRLSGRILFPEGTVSISAGGKVTQNVNGWGGLIDTRYLSIDAGGDVSLSHPQNGIGTVAIKATGTISLNTQKDLSLIAAGSNQGLTSTGGQDITVTAKSLTDSPGNGINTAGKVSLATTDNIILRYSSAGSFGNVKSDLGNIFLFENGGRPFILAGTMDATWGDIVIFDQPAINLGVGAIIYTRRNLYLGSAGSVIQDPAFSAIHAADLHISANGTVDLQQPSNSFLRADIRAAGEIYLKTMEDLTLANLGQGAGLASTGNKAIAVTAKSLTENPGNGIVTDGIVSITTTGGDVLLTTGASHIKQAAITSYGNILLGTMEDLQLVSFGGNAGLKSLNKGDIRVEAKSIKDSPGNGILTEGRFAVQALNDILLDHSSIGSLDWADSFDGNIRINNQGGRALELTGGVATHRSSSSVFIGNEGDLILKPGSYLGSDEGGEFVLAATGDFKNESGSANPLHLPNGRWLVYSADPAGIVKGGMVSDFRQYGTPASAGVTGTGNGFIYVSAKPTVEVDVRNKYGATSHVYGDTPDVRLFPMTTAIGQADNEDYNMGFGLTSAFQYSLTPAADTAPGTYRIRYTGGLENSLGFTMVAGPGFNYMVIPSQAWLDAHRPVRPAGANTTAEDALLRASAPWGDFSNWPLTMAPCVAGPASAPRPGIVVIGSPRRSGNCG